jgi:hypothetical protein
MTADEVVRTAMLTTAVLKMVEMVKQDDDRQVSTTVLDSLKEMLDEIKEPVLSCVERPEILISIVKDVFQQKVSAEAANFSFNHYRKLLISLCRSRKCH